MNNYTLIKRDYFRGNILSNEALLIRTLLGFYDKKDFHVITTTSRVLTKLLCNDTKNKKVETDIMNGLRELEANNLINIVNDEEVLSITLLDSKSQPGIAYTSITSEEFNALTSIQCCDEINTYLLFKFYVFIKTTFRWDPTIDRVFQNRFAHVSNKTIAEVLNITKKEVEKCLDILVVNKLLYVYKFVIHNKENENAFHQIRLIMNPENRYLLNDYIDKCIKRK